jgi:hypothetical protein
MPLIACYLDQMAKAPFHGDDNFGGCGLVVDATVQHRGRPAGQFANVVKYFSGKHRFDCIKSPELVNVSGFAGLVHAGSSAPNTIWQSSAKLSRTSSSCLEPAR